MTKFDYSRFSAMELQAIVCMTGSKKGLGLYLGVEDKILNRIWTDKQLKNPTEYAKSLPKDGLLRLISIHGNTKRTAEYLGVSEATLRLVLRSKCLPDPNQLMAIALITKELIQEYLERYRSIRLATRMINDLTDGHHRLTETSLREKALEHGLDLSQLLDWSFSEHSNSKGRRAELDFLKIREDRIEEDLNLTQGSQAEFDFKDKELGRVNVKSSRCFKWKAKTRKENPHYWKFSTRGHEKADNFFCMAYDKEMNRLVGYVIIPVSFINEEKTLIVKEERLIKCTLPLS